MADEGMLKTVPTDATGTGALHGGRGDALQFLSASWINERIMNVTALVDEYLDRIIDRGLLVDGFGPFESPVTDDMLVRMTPDQFHIFYELEPTIEGRARLLQRMELLKVPWVAYKETKPESPYQPPARLAQEPPSVVGLSG
jgi:hypothetical protein